MIFSEEEGRRRSEGISTVLSPFYPPRTLPAPTPKTRRRTCVLCDKSTKGGHRRRKKRGGEEIPFFLQGRKGRRGSGHSLFIVARVWRVLARHSADISILAAPNSSPHIFLLGTLTAGGQVLEREEKATATHRREADAQLCSRTRTRTTNQDPTKRLNG